MKKKLFMVMMTAVMVFSGSMTAFAAPETMPDGTIFDAEYYAQNNPDIVAELGTDRDALYNHYVTFGKNEGRLAYEQESNMTASQEARGYYIFTNLSTVGNDVDMMPNMSSVSYFQTQIKVSRPLMRKASHYRNGDTEWNDYIYDSRGNLIEETKCDEYGIEWVEYVYDSQNKKIRKNRYLKDGTLSYWYEYSYDSQGNLINETGHNCAEYMSELREKNDYSYDASGRLTQKIEYDYNGKISKRHEYTYNEQGQLIRVTDFYSDNELAGRLDYDYDTQGNMIKKTDYHMDGSLNLWYEYSYDGEGRLVEEAGYNYDNSFRNRYTYNYDSEGNLIKTVEEYNIEGNINRRWWEYIY